MSETHDFLDVNLDDALELEAAPADTDMDLVVLRAIPKPEFSAIILWFEITNGDYKDFSEFLNFPKPDMSTKERGTTINKIKKFSEALGMTPDEVGDVDNWGGRSGSATLLQKDAGDYGIQNKIKAWNVRR